MAITINRSEAPHAAPLNNVSLSPYQLHTLKNGIPVYTMQHGEVEAVTLQAIFKAGKAYQKQIGLASYAARNMQEGTKSYSSLKLAQTLDSHGAWIGHYTGTEYEAFQMTTLAPHLPQTLPILEEILFKPILSEEEFEKMRQRSIQQLSVESQKTRYQAKRLFGHLMYGKSHPYGMHVDPEHIEALSIDAIREYHQTYFYPGNYVLAVVGNFDEDKLLLQLEELLGQAVTLPGVEPVTEQLLTPITFEPTRSIKQMEGMQATIRLGHMGFERNHPDYYGMQVVNTILGGYFGSRLMQNIREEKGYTYGIYSGWVGMKYSGYFVVQSDVGIAYVEPTIEEIKKEMTRLGQEEVSEKELTLVKNYLLGKSINQRETPFQLSDTLRFSIVNDISFEEIDRKFDVIKHIQAPEIAQLARQYLKPDQMLEVICGNIGE